MRRLSPKDRKSWFREIQSEGEDDEFGESSLSLARAYEKLGVDAFREGNLGRAVIHFLEALRLNPESVDANNNLGLVYAEQSDFVEAEKYSAAPLTVLDSLTIRSGTLTITNSVRWAQDV